MNDLTYSALEKALIAREWRLYRTLALGAGNEAINRVRSRIRTELKKPSSLSLDSTPLTDRVIAAIWSFAKTTISDLTPSRARAMIIYEVMGLMTRQEMYKKRIRNLRTRSHEKLAIRKVA